MSNTPGSEDISPDMPNGLPRARPSAAGVIVGLAGDENALYAVSLDAGVWKSEANGPWVQLPHSPKRAWCIAVDPADNRHLAVGERNGDAVSFQLNQSGVWESHDGGDNWSYSFNPASLAGCNSQAIPSIAFSSSATLFVASSCGIGRKPLNSYVFDFGHSPPGIRNVRAIVSSENKVWARTDNELLYTETDGITWEIIPFPPSVQSAVPIAPLTWNDRGDAFSLAAFDFIAFLSVCCDPSLGPDGRPDGGNNNVLLSYHIQTQKWTTEHIKFNGQVARSGTGLGGRRFVKSYVVYGSNLPNIVGKRLQLFFSGSQEIYQAGGLNFDGSVSHWNRIVTTTASDGGGPVHSDLWDFHISPYMNTAWAACDGGVYQKDLRLGQAHEWTSQNEGLHTHHVHTLTVLPTQQGSTRLAYPTADNDAWFKGDTGEWNYYANLGDVNWTAADSGNPEIALFVRFTGPLPNPGVGAELTTFGNSPPSGSNFTPGQRFILSYDPGVGLESFKFIQTLKAETPTYPLLDALMLIRVDPNGRAINPVLIRNKSFAANPEVKNLANPQWQTEFNDLPAGVMGFLVSGGHANPTYYVYTVDGNGAVAIYKRVASNWQQLNVSGVLRGGSYGPVFVNPYDPNQVFVLTNTGVQVSQISTTGDLTFNIDKSLTSLITGFGRFPLQSDFFGGNDTDITQSSRANVMSTLSHMAFNRDNPSEIVAASPYTGVFYSKGGGNWIDLSIFLPRPHTPISSVGIDAGSVFVATEGRSILRIYPGLLPPEPHIELILSDCAVGPVEGGRATFRVTFSDLTDVDLSQLKYHWTVTGAQPVSGDNGDNATFSAIMPSPPGPVSITVTVTDLDGAETMTSTVTPKVLDLSFAELLVKLCNLIHDVKVNFYVNPLSDPPRDFVNSPISRQNLTQIEQAAQNIVTITQRMLRGLQ